MPGYSNPLTKAEVQSRAARFWSYVKIGAAHECWPWQKSCRSGYGQFSIGKGRIEATHKIAYALENGDIPADINVLHECDNRPCCNPRHLFLGTHGDNVADMWAKGRMRSHYKPGVRHPDARLSAADVDAIRGAIGTYSEIARRFGVHPSHVSRIRSGARWATP